MKAVRLFFPAVLFFYSILTKAQVNGDIYLLDILKTDSGYTFSNPENITQHKGYDNQPYFSSDNKYIYFTSMREDSTADIYRYHIEKKLTEQITKTPLISEFSPKEMPGGKNISVVTIEEDGSTQLLRKLNKNGGTSSVVSKHIDSIGYYTWKNENSLFAFILGKNEIHILRELWLPANKKETFREIIIDDSIGRCFYQHLIVIGKKTANCIYLKKTGDKNKLVFYDSIEGNIALELETPGKGEDFVFALDNEIWMAAGNKMNVFAFHYPYKWKELDSFNFPGLKNITRIAISGDGKKLAVVAEDEYP